MTRLKSLRRSGGATLAAFVLAAAAAAGIAAPAYAAGTARYVDCSAQTNGSGTLASPYNSIAAVNALTLSAGDSVQFKAGTTCTGQLAPQGSGASGAPITVSAYGSGAKPILDAAGATGAVIKLLNQQYWEISGLELRNAAKTPDYRQGILAENSSGTTLHHIKVTGMTIDNISGWSGGWYATNAGVGIQTDHSSTTSTWDDIVVSGNTFDHVDRIAVAVTPDKDGQGTGLSTNVVISNNVITYSGGDDILVVKGDGAQITGNTASYGGSKSLNACPPSGQYCNGASASIWMSGSTGTIVRSNSVACFVNEADGQAYDVDWGNHNTTVERNYSRNNRGGSILLMPPINVPNEPSSGTPSDGTVVRYNVSVGDTDTTGCPLQPASQGPRSVIHFAGGIPNQSGSSSALPVFSHNTYFVPASVTADVIGSRAGSNPSGSYIFRNNLIENFGSGGYITTSGSTFQNNLYYGNHPSTEPAGTGTVTLDPQFVGPLPTSTTPAPAAAFALRPSSPALNAGIANSADGTVDYNGAAVAATPSIGAFEGSTNAVSNPGFETGTLGQWFTSGSGTASTVTTTSAAQGADAVVTGAANSGVEQSVSGLTPGATYLVTGWTRVANAGEAIAIGVKNAGTTEVYARSTSTTWAPTSVYVTLGSSATSANVYCYKNTGTGSGYCDSISLQRISSPTNLVTNPGFESTTLSPWVTTGSGTASAASSSAANTGSAGLATGAANSGAQETITGLAPGTSYVLSAWLRTASGEQVALGVKDFGGQETYQRVSSTTFAPATVTFTTSTNATSATVYCYKNSGSSAAACDDFRLTPLG